MNDPDLHREPILVWEDDREISIYAILRPLVRYRRWILGSTLLFGAAAIVFALTRPASFTATAKFVPEADEESPVASLSRLSGLAGQFGIDVGGTAPMRSPVFYAELLRTEQILNAAVKTRYSFIDSVGEAPHSVAGDLVDLLEVQGETPAIRTAEARERLEGEMLSVETDVETGIVTTSVRSPWPGLSAQVGQRMLDLLNQFNLETRQSQAAMERRFVEARLEEARGVLRAAEDSLKEFLVSTRRFEMSPELTFERERLQRQVDFQEQLYSSLSEALQRARIDEVRDIPVITVIDRPTPPAQPDDRRLLLNLILGLALGGLVGTGGAYARAFLERSDSEGGEDYQRFIREVQGALQGPRNVVRRARSLLPGTSPKERDSR